MAEHGLVGPATIDHLGFLEDLTTTPGYLAPGRDGGALGHYSCAFCGVGDGGAVSSEVSPAPGPAESGHEIGLLRVRVEGRIVVCAGFFGSQGWLEVESDCRLAGPGELISGELEVDGRTTIVVGKEIETRLVEGGGHSHTFLLTSPLVGSARTTVAEKRPTAGCVKLRISLGMQRGPFPIHVEPSALAPGSEPRGRVALDYGTAIAAFVDLLLAHRPPHGRTLFYGCGQIDYFTVFAAQEVLRLLGVRNLAGNAEHCLNAGAVHNEMLTGQEGPFVTVEAGLGGPGRFHLLNGWNGLITHPPAFQQLLRRPDLDAYLVEVAGTESAEALARKLGPDRVLFIRPAGDPHLALAVAHEVLHRHPGAVDLTFVERYADGATFDAYTSLAGSDRFAPEAVATRLAPEPGYRDRLLAGIGAIASRLASPSVVPVNIPSVGLSQTKGAVAHCLWGDVLALVGKYGLRPDGSLAGGTLRLPGQINAQTEVQGLSRRVFMGRIPVTDEGAVDAARRMGLPDDAYRPLVAEPARAALDYSDPTDEPELFVCFGTQFESNMMERARWVRKLEDPRVRLVVVDPIPDPFTLARADLVIPSPPHGAAGKLYQNGEWRFTLSSPRKRSAPQTRTDATILYDAMAEVSRRLGTEPPLAAAHPDLAGLAASGYLRDRFEAPESGGGLERVDGEVSRPQLWARVLAYMTGGRGHLYCRPEHPDGRPLAWDDLLGAGSVVSGGVGTTRYRLDYDDPAHMPFGDIYRRPRRFTFFVPTEGDLALPTGIILSSGRSTMSDDRRRIRFATSTFNSGKATPATDMPEENALHVSPTLATTSGLASGNRVRVVNRATGHSIVLPVVVTDRVKGQATYVSFHKTRAELEQGRYLNTVTGHLGRCPYTAQSSFKATEIVLERVEASDTEAAGVEPQEDGK